MSAVTKRISLIAAYAILFSAPAFSGGAENLPHNSIGKVRILILSKHIRLLKEGLTGPLEFSFPSAAEIDSGKKRFLCRRLGISHNNGSFSVRTGENIPVKENFTLFPSETADTFSVEINGEKRTYPLPLYVRNQGPEMELSVEDTTERYAIDSAWCELGDLNERYPEALYALALIIKARCALPYLAGKHPGYHFCDLTCCQTYKGRSGKTFDDPVSISTANIRNGLFFNSSSGGTVFTDSIFNGSGRTGVAPKDVIYSENFTLSSEKYPSWTASITADEISGILYPHQKKFLKSITFDRSREIVFVKTGNGDQILSPESFRIRINRVRGWNFLKSNNYSITLKAGEYTFTGSGLGHGAGMSFEGALQLAERGYSRYEIIEHYYPGTEYTARPGTINHQLQYTLFNPETGEIIKSSSRSFVNRVIPCGSIFKLFIALYLAEKRTDLFYSYKYNCTDSEKDGNIPEQCWNRTGHGRMNISSALFNSCNKYFASLYGRIDKNDFLKWLADFTVRQGIELTVPEIKNSSGFSTVLAGLNFNLTITVDGIIKLNRYLYNAGKDHKSDQIELIMNALHKTFTAGTAKESEAEKNSHKILPPYNDGRQNLWGKTGTVIAGTNSHHGYGIFTGGLNSTGIVSILRKGTGAMAAKESAKLLLHLIPLPLSERNNEESR